MRGLVADLKQALRLVRTSPGFTAAVVAAIALGIGANTAIFSVFNAVLLKPLPFPEPDRIVQVQIRRNDVAVFGPNTSPAKFLIWRELDDVFADIAGNAPTSLTLTERDAPEHVAAAGVSEAFFRVLGAPIARGRTFTLDEDLPNAAPSVVLSHRFWSERLGADPSIVGKPLSLNGRPYTVVGVVGEGFDTRELGDAEVWVPLQLDPASTEQAHFFVAFARLAPGVTLDQARARLQTAVATYRERYTTAARDGESFTAVALQDALVGSNGRTLWVLLGAVAFVLLIACANVANLMLVRASRRRREIAIRAALGAGRRRIVQQLLTESVLLSAVGGALGIVVGFVAMRALLAIDTAGLPRLGDGGTLLGMDWRVLAFSGVLSLATGLLFGLAPALVTARVDLNGVVKAAGSRSGNDRREGRTRSALVLVEVMLAVVLLIGAALLIRTSIELARVEPGFSADNVLVLRTTLSGARYARTDDVAQVLRTGREQLLAVPGVVAVGAGCCVPTQFTSNFPFNVMGREQPEGASSGTSDFAMATPGYFAALRVPLLRGRDFSDTDDAGAPGAVIVNQAFADRFFRDTDALGQRILVGAGRMQIVAGESEREIIGIVGNVHNRGLDDEPTPAMYVPQAQLPDDFNAFYVGNVPTAWIVRTLGNSAALSRRLEDELRQITGVPVLGVQTMESIVSLSTSRERFNMLLMSVFGVAAFVLAGLGIYGLLAYSVQQRTQELGIRVALGAEPRRIRGMILRQGGTLLSVGVACGVAAAFYLSGFLASVLFGVQPRDGLVFVAVPTVLAVFGLATVAFVAWRASHVDPLVALRHD
jgi:predicted permease